MILKWKKLHKDAIIPKYMTQGSVGFDLYSIEDKLIFYGGKPKFVRTGLAVEIPHGHQMTVRQRSGLSLRFPNYIAIGVGTIDFDYRGELKVPVMNHNNFVIKIHKGDRIAQGIISPIVQCLMFEVNKLSDTDRGTGGFGHTG